MSSPPAPERIAAPISTANYILKPETQTVRKKTDRVGSLAWRDQKLQQTLHNRIKIRHERIACYSFAKVDESRRRM